MRAPLALTSMLCALACTGCASMPVQAEPSSRTRAPSSAVRSEAELRPLVPEPRWLTERGVLEVGLAPLTARLAEGEVHVMRQDIEDECFEDLVCMRLIARTLGATHVLAVELAGLGSTMMVRLRLVPTDASLEDVVRQQVVEDATLARVEDALAAMAEALIEPLRPAPEPAEREPERRAWYERGYVYAIGAALVAGAVGTGIGVHRYRARQPDVVIVPP